jgi:phosphoribosylglycinamide formyltransferase-1
MTVTPCVILISGRGSNLQAIVHEVVAGKLPLEIRAVISNRPQASGLGLARCAGLVTQVLDHTRFADREAYDAALLALIDSYQPQLVILAGFMRILTARFVRHYRGHLLNIHPSLLPDFPGLDTHRRALTATAAEHGASVHFVTEAVDGGPVILQARVPVLPQDNAETLAARVLAEEHRIYPQALRWFAEGRLHLEQRDGRDCAVLDGKTLDISEHSPLGEVKE